MSEVETVIETIKALSPQDKAKVAAFLRELESEQTEVKPRIMEDAVFYKAADATFSKHDDLLKKLAQ